MHNENTLSHYLFEATEEQQENIIKDLSSFQELLTPDRRCYIYGYGKQPKSIYRQLEKEENISVLWAEFMGKGLIKYLKFIIAGYAGLVRIKNTNEIELVIRKLGHSSMVGIFSISHDFQKEFEEYMIKSKSKSNPEEYVKNDSTYFSLMIDEDNVESKTGILVINSYGKKCPMKIVNKTIEWSKGGKIKRLN